MIVKTSLLSSSPCLNLNFARLGKGPGSCRGTICRRPRAPPSGNGDTGLAVYSLDADASWSEQDGGLWIRAPQGPKGASLTCQAYCILETTTGDPMFIPFRQSWLCNPGSLDIPVLTHFPVTSFLTSIGFVEESAGSIPHVQPLSPGLFNWIQPTYSLSESCRLGISRSKKVTPRTQHFPIGIRCYPADFREAGACPERIICYLFLIDFPLPTQPAFPAFIFRILSNLRGLGGSWGEEKEVVWENPVARTSVCPPTPMEGTGPQGAAGEEVRTARAPGLPTLAGKRQSLPEASK